MGQLISQSITLLCIAAIVAVLARRLRLPYTVGLVAAGAVLALSGVGLGVQLTHELIFEVLLPPLLFEAAMCLNGRELRSDALPIALFSTVGLLAAAVLVAAGLMYLLGWSPGPAMVFAALITATDPVSVIAMMKDHGIKGRTRLLVEAESLFNDGTASVLFVTCLAWALNPVSALPVTEIGRSLGLMVGGGILIGGSCGALAILMMGRIDDTMVETSLTAVAAYGSFLLAEHVHASGVIATVVAGLLIGNLGVLKEVNNASTHNTGYGRQFVIDFWSLCAFVANSVIFMLIGAALAEANIARIGYAAIGVAVLLSIVSRALTVYPITLLLRRTSLRIEPRLAHVLWWGGLRGALALALALSLPAQLEHRDDILTMAFAVVAFSVIVQGLSMPWVLRQARPASNE